MIHIEKNNIPPMLKEFPTYLYGGGYTGKVIIDLFSRDGVEIRGIIDDDEGLQGEKILGIPVISFEEFCTEYQSENNINVVLTSIYGKTILKKLRILEKLKIFELYDWYNDIIGMKGWINTKNVNELEILKQEWNLLKGNWSDKDSIKVLDGVWKYLKTRDLNVIADICTDQEQYFIPEVLSAIKSPLCIIDAGAYRGELFQSFTQNNLCIKKWYCFEPDPENYSMLVRQSKRNNLEGKQECINKGLWDKSGKLYFEGGRAVVSRIVPYNTTDFAEVVSIDEFINMGECNFIKMDIEGSELPALKGGQNVIKRERPILAISIYHSVRDYWEIPKFLMSELENYQYYVRQHALIGSETVLYAIPL